MNIQEILTDDALRHHEFPVTRSSIFLAHAGVCPLPRRVHDAVRQYSEQSTLGDQEAVPPAADLGAVRTQAAQLLGVNPAEIALIGPTSHGLSQVANGLRWRRGQNVLIYFDDYPSNVYPWMALADRGIEVRLMNIRQLGRIRPIDVIGQIDENTRLVALASCHFIAGYRIDIDAIGRALRERGILFCLDAIQTLGAFPTPLAHVDFMAADAHKWLLGPCGAGLLYVRQALQDHLRPIALGWHNVRCPNFVAQEDIELRPDARRYEAGTQNFLGIAGLHAAIQLILELGVDSIAAELQRKRALLAAGLAERGWHVLHPDLTPAQAGAIVSASKPGLDLPNLHAQLARDRIVVSLRTDRSGQKYLRFSPHLYNTDAELHRVLDSL